MNPRVFYLAGDTPSLRQAETFLLRRGCDIRQAPDTSVTHLLLPVPTVLQDGALPGGEKLEELLLALPDTVKIFGGNLPESLTKTRQCVDFLQDPQYLTDNAAITADCAIRVAAARLPAAWRGCQVLILGWGRIGKLLGQQLKALGAEVTVAARKASDRALLRTLGYAAETPHQLGPVLGRYRVVFNTIPAPVISPEQAEFCRHDAVLVDLASVPGISGAHVISARGLPGKMAPESAGNLIGLTALRLAASLEEPL